MTKTIHGRINGKTIELDEDLGAPEGQEVEVQVRLLGPKKTLPGPPPGWHSGSASPTAGLLSDLNTELDDRILQEIYGDRQRDFRRELPE